MELDELINTNRIELEAAKRIQNEYDIGYYTARIDMLKIMGKHTYGADKPANIEYPQSTEENEYRHIDPKWLDEIATGLTAGAKNHPGETWRGIPAVEHAARAMRHINMYRDGDRSDSHLINASMRLMMAYVMDKEALKS